MDSDEQGSIVLAVLVLALVVIMALGLCTAPGCSFSWSMAGQAFTKSEPTTAASANPSEIKRPGGAKTTPASESSAGTGSRPPTRAEVEAGEDAKLNFYLTFSGVAAMTAGAALFALQFWGPTRLLPKHGGPIFFGLGICLVTMAKAPDWIYATLAACGLGYGVVYFVSLRNNRKLKAEDPNV